MAALFTYTLTARPAFTAPAPLEGAAALLGQDVLFQDGTRQLAARKDYALVADALNVVLSFNRRLLADRGSMAMRPEYGGNLRNWVNKPDTAANRARIAQIVRDQATQERRIAAMREVSVTPETRAGKPCAVIRYVGQLIDGNPLAGELVVQKEL